MKVLFVCRGNVGRSQMAEAIFRSMAPNSFQVASVGTKVVDTKGVSREGEKLKDRAGAKGVLDVLQEIGIDARDAERNQINETHVNDADLIVLMAERETVPEYMRDNPKIRIWDIQDPKEQGIETLRKIREQITTLCKDLVLEFSSINTV